MINPPGHPGSFAIRNSSRSTRFSSSPILQFPHPIDLQPNRIPRPEELSQLRPAAFIRSDALRPLPQGFDDPTPADGLITRHEPNGLPKNVSIQLGRRHDNGVVNVQARRQQFEDRFIERINGTVPGSQDAFADIVGGR